MKEANDMNQEEAKEISFVRCDNKCSEKTLTLWQFASVVMKEGEESYTTKLCQQCYNKSLEAKRRQNIDKVAVV